MQRLKIRFTGQPPGNSSCKNFSVKKIACVLGAKNRLKKMHQET